LNVITTTLGDVCRMDRRTLSTAEAIKAGLTFVGMEHVNPDSGRITAENGSRTGEGKAQSFCFDSRHVLFGKLRPYLRKIALPEGDGCSSTELVPLLPDPKRLDRGYLFHWLRRSHVIDVLMAKNTGARMPRADMSVLLAMLLPLPHLDEQRRIVALLDRAAEIRRRAEAARAKARAIIPALFLDTFGDPATNPKGWPVTALGNVADVQGGLQVSAAREVLPVELPYLRVANILRGTLELSEIKLIRMTESERERTLLRTGDVLIVEGHGNPKEIGRAAVWDGSIDPCTHQNHLIRVRVYKDLLAAHYLETFLNSESGRSILIKSGKTTSGLNTISTRNVKAVQLPSPPLQTQTDYAEQVQRIEALARNLDAAAANAEATAAALSAEVFR
jgi:type I restriction enzyme, S subunit